MSERASERASERTNSSLTSHQQRGHMETGPRFKASSERPEKRGIDHAMITRKNTVLQQCISMQIIVQLLC